MEVFCVTVEYEGVRPSDNYTSFTLWATLEGARRALKQERKDILKKPGWSKDTIEADEDDRFSATIDEYYSESYNVTISKEPVHE